MATRVKSWLSKPNLLRRLLWQVRLAFRLLREPRVPVLSKLLPLLALIYIVSPLDFLPDVFPVLGQLDDLGIAVFALELFLRLCPTDTKAFHQAAMSQGRAYSPMVPVTDVINAEWRRE